MQDDPCEIWGLKGKIRPCIAKKRMLVCFQGSCRRCRRLSTGRDDQRKISDDLLFYTWSAARRSQDGMERSGAVVVPVVIGLGWGYGNLRDEAPSISLF